MILGIPWWAWIAWAVLAAAVVFCLALMVAAGVAARREERERGER